MIKKYRNYLLGVIGVLLALTMLVGVKYLMKPKYEELPEVKLINIKDNKSFAIMIQNGDGYEEYSSDTWPGSEYVYKEAKCVDNNGSLVDDAITFADGKATLKTNKTIYCTLYFDKYVPLNLKTLCENYDNMEACITNQKDEIKEIEHLGPEPESDQVEMYRYQGTDDVPNWILFGTREKCEKDKEEKCTNSKLNNMTYDEYVDKYMYRIIGITEEGQMYLIKETFLKEESGTNTFEWNKTKYLISACLGEACEWPNVDLYKRLNGIVSNGNPIFVNNSEYEYMTKDGDWYNLIDGEHKWMYGDTNMNNYDSNTYNGDYMYAIETGKIATKRYWPDESSQTKSCGGGICTEKDYTWSKSVPAKIGLMYIHDVDYAYPGGNPESMNNVKNSWIYFQKDGYHTDQRLELLISREGTASSTNNFIVARAVDRSYGLAGSNLNNAYSVRPTFYLESSAKIASGEGTKDSPFILA